MAWALVAQGATREGPSQGKQAPPLQAFGQPSDGLAANWSIWLRRCPRSWWSYAGPEGLVKEGIHLDWRCRSAVMDPPVEQRKEGACAGVGQGGAAGRGE